MLAREEFVQVMRASKERHTEWRREERRGEGCTTDYSG